VDEIAEFHSLFKGHVLIQWRSVMEREAKQDARSDVEENQRTAGRWLEANWQFEKQ